MTASDVSCSLVVLKTRDVETMRRFYSALGIVFSQERHGRGPVHFAACLGALVLEIYPLDSVDAAAETSVRLGFSVAGLEDVVKHLESLGTKIIARPKATQWGYRAVVLDPDGRSIDLVEKSVT